MNDDQTLHSNMKKIDRFFYCFSTQIHEGHRFDKSDFLSIDLTFSVEGFKASCGNKDVIYLGESIHHLKSDIVSAHLVADPRIPESYNDFHPRLFFLLFFFLLLLLLLYLCPFSSLCNHLFHYLLLLDHRRHDSGDGKVGVC